MECNRDEALRAKLIAERKLETKDYSGAKKFALKAQNLYAGLEGISHMLTTIDVYVSAENKISGEVDFYGVLGVPPSVDDETLKKQYRKLALVLHPDKNKSVGADGAFKLIAEAWSLLSDKTKRLAYNQRRGPRGFYQKVEIHSSAPSVRPRENGFHSFSGRPASVPKSRPSTAPSAVPTAPKARPSAVPSAVPTAPKARPSAAPSAVPTPCHKRSDTFWTICHRCKMHYEYLKVYLNNTLVCPNCHEPFIAKETAAPFGHSMSSNSTTGQNHQGSTSQSSRGTSGPCSNTPRPGSNAPRPGSNAPRPGSNAPRPGSNAPRPGSNAPRPGSNAPRPGSNAPRPGSNAPRPGSNAPRPGSNAPRPGSNAPRPGSNAPRPGSNAPRPVPAGQSAFNHADLRRGQPSSSASGNSLDPSIALRQEKLKRDQDASQIFSSFSNGQTLNKKSRVDTDNYPFGGNTVHWPAMGNNNGSGSSGSNRDGSEARSIYSVPGNHQKAKSFREITPNELRYLLAQKGLNEIQKKLDELNPKTSAKAEGMKKEQAKTVYYQGKYIGKQHDMNGINEPSASKRSDPVKNSCHRASDVEKEGNPEAVSMKVPDPDFHDFDMDRTENSFLDNEVWAAYDDDDGMPRFYALISKVISRKPFRVKLSWLNSRTNSEFATIDWVGSGFYKTCGEFRVGNHKNYTSINAFSHKVKWFKGPRGTVQIFPKKGDVWALYRNWSPDWNQHTLDEVIHKYEMTLVLNDYNEEEGISVAPLVKVDGFRTVFYPYVDAENIRRIPKEEMFRFSHQVPNYLLTGEEAKNAPKDCHELDPASTPVELLQVATEVERPPGKNNGDVMDTERQSATQVG